MRKIIHCDADCFYASVEMRDNPKLASVPIAIGGSADRRGVIATCNYPARKFGVRSAMSTYQALQRCPDLLVVPGNMAKYREASLGMRVVFERYTDTIEPLSLDEAYLDVTHSTYHNGSATLMAEDIRQAIFKEVGITVSTGIASNKFLAKVASDWHKPNGSFTVTPANNADFSGSLSLKLFPGVGRVTYEKCEKLGLKVGTDVRQQGQPFMVQHFGKFGERLFHLAGGLDTREVAPHRERKSMSVERTFSQDINSAQAIAHELVNLMADLSNRIQKKGLKSQIKGLVVKVKFHDFVQHTAETQSSTVEETVFSQLAMGLWAREKKPLRLLGIGVKLSSLAADNSKQLSLSLD